MCCKQFELIRLLTFRKLSCEKLRHICSFAGRNMRPICAVCVCEYVDNDNDDDDNSTREREREWVRRKKTKMKAERNFRLPHQDAHWQCKCQRSHFHRHMGHVIRCWRWNKTATHTKSKGGSSSSNKNRRTEHKRQNINFLAIYTRWFQTLHKTIFYTFSHGRVSSWLFFGLLRDKNRKHPVHNFFFVLPSMLDDFWAHREWVRREGASMCCTASDSDTLTRQENNDISN